MPRFLGGFAALFVPSHVLKGAMTDPGQMQPLVEKARAGDKQAFDDLVRSYEPRLRSSVERRLGRGKGDSQVDEVVQETFVLAFEAIGRFKWQGEASFFGWLSRIARNLVIDHAKDARRNRFLEVPERLAVRNTSPSKVLRRGERFDRLEGAIDGLPPDYREVLRLSHLERLKVKEIAERMGRTEYAVKHLLARALRKLRESFGDTESLNLPDRPLNMEEGELRE